MFADNWLETLIILSFFFREKLERIVNLISIYNLLG